MGRRARGDGAVYFDQARGVWVGAVELGRDPETGRRVRRKVSGATKTEAKDRLGALRDEKHRTGTVGRRDITVETVVRDLLASRPADWRSPVTVRVNTGHAERIIAAIGKKRLAKLTVAEAERFLTGLADAGLARKTIAGTKGLGARAVRRAQRDGLVGRNVFELADMPAAGRRRSRAMTLDQVRALLRVDLTPFWRAYITVGAMCGLRPGELLDLRWQDVDFDAGVVRVRKGRAHAGLKTAQSRRTLVMPAAVAGALRALKAEQAAAKLRLGRLYADSGAVFAGEAGQPRPRRGVETGFQRQCERAGLGAGWQPRELRHTFVSVLSDAGIDIEAIADAAGHINSNVTRTVYRHQIADKVAVAAAEMDRIFGTGSAS